MTNTDRHSRPALHAMDEEQAGLLDRLAADYADALPKVREREPQASIAPVLHAVRAHQAQRIWGLRNIRVR